MPARVVVNLEPRTAGALPPPQTGPGVNAAVLAAVARVAPGMAAAIHDTAGYKPITVTPLLDESDQPVSRVSREVRFEVGVLAEELTGPILGALGGAETIRVGNTHYRVKDAYLGAATSYADILGHARQQAAWAFRLVTPTGFASARGQGARRQLPWPDPVRVLGNLADRWRHFAGGTALPDGIRPVLEWHVEVVDYSLRTAEHLVKAGEPPRRGAIGRVAYGVAEAHRVAAGVLAALDALARYAAYAGFGDRTAVGMGVVRLGEQRQP